jgi:hypothetical protein
VNSQGQPAYQGDPWSPHRAPRHHLRRALFIGEETGICEQPKEDVGLLSMCFQADLWKQFEFIQDNWANAPGFPGKDLPLGGFEHHGIDPIAGQFEGIQPVPPEKISATDLLSRSQPWPARYGSTSPAMQAPFWGFVTLLGGQYFFAPSLSGLLSLLMPKAEPAANPSATWANQLSHLSWRWTLC